MGRIETVKVKDGPAGARIINKADFVAGKHELFREPAPEHVAGGKKQGDSK